MLHGTSVGLVNITAILKAVDHLDHCLNLIAINVFACGVDSSQQSGDVLGNNSPVGLQLLHGLVLADLQNQVLVGLEVVIHVDVHYLFLVFY